MFLFSFLSAVLLHECGHLFALSLFRAKIRKFKLSPFGMTIAHSLLSSHFKNFSVAFCGPLFGLIGFLATHHSSSFRYFALFSLLLSLFNLLPIQTLDGYQMTNSIFSLCLSPHAAERVSKLLSHAFLFLLWLLGIYLFLILDQSPSLFFMALALFFQETKTEESLKIA